STPTSESATQTNLDTKSDTRGKIYSKCELAQELYRKHHIPMEQIPIWVCIVQHESGFNTSAIARLNADGSADHGLFQISDLYWCSHDRSGGKACNISCDDLLDSDISDDVRCAKTIYEEHTRMSGDGFTAWSVYKPHCLNRSLRGIWSCFSHQNVDEIKIEINISIKGTRIPELHEQIKASQNVSSNNSEEFLKGSIKFQFQKNDNQLYISNLFVNDNSTNNNPEQNSMDSLLTLSTTPPTLGTATTVSQYDNNSFLKGSIKLQTKGNGKQVYISNRFLNENSTNDNPEHNSMDLLSILSTSPRVLLGNLSAITTVSQYDNNPFSKGAIKLQARENGNQMYLSNPLLNGNSTNDKPEHSSKNSSSKLSTNPPVLLRNLSASTAISPYDNHPFLKEPVKLQAKVNNNQVYLSSRFLNDNSTNNNPENNSMDSISTLSTSPPLLHGNLNTITTLSPYDNNPFLKPSIKYQVKGNGSQSYISNPLLDGNSTNDKPEHSSNNSSSTVSINPPLLLQNLSTITTISPYDNNPFLKETIKLQAKENDDQVYISNRFLNDNFTNNNPAHNSMGSSPTLPIKSPVLLGKLSATTTVSPYDNNPFLKRPIKLQAEENPNQLYISNRFLNDNSTNNNPENNSMDSLSTLSTSPPLPHGNLNTITNLSPSYNNPFLKGSIKYQVTGNGSQSYISNPLLNGNSTNGKREQSSNNSSSTLPISPPVLLRNLSAITTASPYDNNPFLKGPITFQAKENAHQVYISSRFLNDNSTNNNPENNAMDSLSTLSTSPPLSHGNLNTITTLSPYDNNPFLKGSIKLQIKGNSSQSYISNPLLNHNSTNDKPEHSSNNSSSTLSISPPVLLRNLSAITTASPYDNNPFLKRPIIKLQAKQNAHQVYISNPLLNDNSEINKLVHNSTHS
uniref:lysozyme n=1 Tax=Glossina pallidipes TaxID=7398 RepID=A0A1B0A293_GLOPL